MPEALQLVLSGYCRLIGDVSATRRQPLNVHGAFSNRTFVDFLQADAKLIAAQPCAPLWYIDLLFLKILNLVLHALFTPEEQVGNVVEWIAPKRPIPVDDRC